MPDWRNARSIPTYSVVTTGVRAIKKLARFTLWTVNTLFFIFVLIAIAFGALHSSWGRDQLARLIERQLSDETTTVSVEGIEGIIPLGFQLERFAMADKDGVWLEVEQVDFDVSIRNLFRGWLRLQAVGAERVTLLRLPESDAPPPPPSDEPFALPELPELPASLPDLAIRRLYVDHLHLGEAVIGRALDIAILGEVRTADEGRAVTADLAIDGRAGTHLTGRLALELGLAAPDLSLDIDITETGGLIRDVAAMPEIGDVRLHWQGAGPLADWRSRLDLHADGIARAGIDLGLDLAATPKLTIDGSIEPAGDLLSADIAALLSQPVTLALAVEQLAPGHFELTALSLESEPLQVAGRADIDQPAGDLQADIRITAADLSRFSAIAGVELGGGVELTLTGENAEPGPAISLKLVAEEVVADQNRIESVVGQFDFAFTKPLQAGFSGTTLHGGLSVDGIVNGDRLLFADTPLTLAVDADIQLEGNSRLDNLTLDVGAATLEASGDVAIADGAGDLTLRGDVPAIAALLAALDVPMPELAGGVAAQVDLTLANQFQDIVAELTLQADGLAGLPGDAVLITGAAPTAGLKAEIALGSTARLSEIRIDLAAADLSGEIEAGLGEPGALAGRFTLAVPKLAALEGLIQQPIAGAANIVLDLGGALQEPEVALDAEVSALAVAGLRIEAIALQATGADLVTAPQGAFSLDIRQPQGSLRLKSDYRLADERLSLDGIALTGPATELAGALAADLAGPLVEGELRGGIRDLAALAPWHGQTLAGSVELDIAMAVIEGRQDISADARIPNLVGDFGTLSELDLRATISDALQVPTIAAELSFGVFEQPDLRVRDTAISANGTLADLVIELQTAGEQANEPFSLVAKASVDAASEAKKVVLQQMQGRAAGQDIRLQRPATIIQNGDVVDIDRLDLVIGAASIEGGLEMGGGQIDGRLALKSLPLNMLNAFGAPDIAGDATGDLTIKGTTAAPRIDLALNAMGLRPNDPAYAAKDGLSLDMNGVIANGSAQTSIEIGNLADDAALVQLAVPLQFAIEPFAFDLPARAALDGSVKGVIDLARITRLAQLDGQVVRGLLRADLEIGGTLDKPEVLGETVLSDGLVEDSTTGLSLKFLRGRLIAERDEMRLEGFEGRDGDGGKIAVDGSVDIRPGRKFPFDVKITSDDMRVLSNEIGRVYVDLDVAVSGNAEGAAANGTITVPRAEIAIPSGGGIDPVALDVEGIGQSKPVEEAAPAPAEASGPGYVVALDLLIDIPSELFVRGRGLDTEWGGRLEISGTSAAPVVIGGIDYRRGFLDFLDRRFEIPQGKISFTGASPPIPEIDLRAEAQGPTLLAIITITGPATAPELELSSEPSRPNDEILSDLLFNRNMSEITPVQALRLANAVRTLEGGGVDTMGQLRNAIGVDTLDIGGDSPEETSAKVGKYVADGVFLELEQGLTTGKSTARVEVELTDNISVNTEVDNESQAGVGLEWSLDY